MVVLKNLLSGSMDGIKTPLKRTGKVHQNLHDET
jgi:hypothetical protein